MLLPGSVTPTRWPHSMGSPVKPLGSPCARGPSTEYTADYLPFTFGAEFELLVHPRAGQINREPVPIDVNHRVMRDFSFKVLDYVAEVLSSNDMSCDVVKPEDESKQVDYEKWNVMMNASIKQMAYVLWPYVSAGRKRLT